MPNPVVPAEHINKIAILRAGTLGDFLFTLPAIQAIRERFPTAEIVLLGKAWHAGFAPGHVPAISRVVTIPAYPGVGEPPDLRPSARALDHFFRDMRAEQFDLAFQMHGGGRYSNRFVNLLGARRTIGSRTPDAEPRDVSVPYVFYQNEVLRHLELGAHAGCTPTRLQPEITLLPEDQAEANRLTQGARNYVVLHPGASDPRRRWPAGQFAAVARTLLDQGLAVYVTGTAAEQDIIAEVVAGTSGRAQRATGLSLGGLAGLLAGARLTISNDTGPLHLARAVGGTTVGIYWCGNYITAGPLHTARHQSLLSWTLACPVCGTPCVHDVPFDSPACTHMVSFVADIPDSAVLRAAQTLLAPWQGQGL